MGALVDVVEEVETATRPLVVETKVRVLLPLTVTTVVTSCSVLLLTDVETKTVGFVDDGDLESVDVTPPVDGTVVGDTEDWEFVDEDWGFDEED